MRSRLHQLVAVSLLWLALSPQPLSLRDTPPILSQGTRPVDWSILRERLDEQSRFYTYVSQLPPPSTTAPKRPATPRPSGFSGGDVWAALASCESGGTNASTGNGFYGYFQFVPSTWRSLGYSGLPTDFDYETQRAGAMQLQARSGWGQWPACSARLGLR